MFKFGYKKKTIVVFSPDRDVTTSWTFSSMASPPPDVVSSHVVELVPDYTYLVLVFSNGLKWNKARQLGGATWL
jgi:hypothetical protein